MAEQFLIVKLSSMGDVIHALPAAQAIRAAFPRCRLGWAVEKEHAPLLHGQRFLDEVIVWDRRDRRRWPGFVRSLRRTRWDVAIDLQGLLRSGVVAWLSGAPRRVGYAPGRELSHWFYTDRVVAGDGAGHAVERSLILADRLSALYPGSAGAGRDPGEVSDGVAGAAPVRFPLSADDDDRAAVTRWLQQRGFDRNRDRLVILNPHCRKDANRWPAERFVALGRRLLERPGVRVALTGGAVARGLCDQIGAQLGDAAWRADGQFSLLGTATLLAHASAVVTGDSGPMHLAVAAGTPVIALFGPSSPTRTGPYAADAVVLDKYIECSPCFGRRCPLRYNPPRCMDLITVEEVYRAVVARLEHGDGPPGAARAGVEVGRP